MIYEKEPMLKTHPNPTVFPINIRHQTLSRQVDENALSCALADGLTHKCQLQECPGVKRQISLVDNDYDIVT